MTQEKFIEFPALEITQPVGQFYIGVMDSRDLVAISSADVRRLSTSEMDAYIGIQRRLSGDRSKELRAYVNSFDATFPTAIILAVEQPNALYDPLSRILKFVETPERPLAEVAKIIDGQHRVDGLSAFEGEKFEVNVSVFVGADIATQANVFATVNLAQTKVNRSLAYDLLAYEELRSPQKVAHNITVALDQIEFSPFYQRIKRLGSATPGRTNETVTQAALVESILDLTSTDPVSDRNAFFHKIMLRKPDSQELQRHPFRKLFIDRHDSDITQIILNYFTAVAERWPQSWNDLHKTGNVLPKTNGVKALMRFLRRIYPELATETWSRVPPKSDFRAVLNHVGLDDADFNTDTFKPGTSGEATLYRALSEVVDGDQPRQFDMF